MVGVVIYVCLVRMRGLSEKRLLCDIFWVNLTVRHRVRRWLQGRLREGLR